MIGVLKKGYDMENKVVKIIVNVLVCIVIILATCITLITISSQKNGYFRIFKSIPLTMKDSSMEPTIKKGSLIITKEYKNNDIKEGDVISYRSIDKNNTLEIKTGRVKTIITVNEQTTYITEFDNKEYTDSEQVNSKNVISIWNGKKVSTLGSIIDFLNTKVGFFICIIVPLALLFIYQLYKFIMLVIDYRKVN